LQTHTSTSGFYGFLGFHPGPLAWEPSPFIHQAGSLALALPVGVLVITYLFLPGGKEATPLPPPENSSSPSSLPALGPLWTTNEEGGEAVEKELPPAEGRLARAVQRGVMGVASEVQLWQEPVFLAATGAILFVSLPLPTFPSP
jgi:hypothetical protein